MAVLSTKAACNLLVIYLNKYKMISYRMLMVIQEESLQANDFYSSGLFSCPCNLGMAPCFVPDHSFDFYFPYVLVNFF